MNTPSERDRKGIEAFSEAPSFSLPFCLHSAAPQTTADNKGQNGSDKVAGQSTLGARFQQSSGIEGAANDP